MVVVGGGEVVHRIDLVTVDEKELIQRHQALSAERTFERILIPDRQDVAPAPVLDGVEHDVGGFVFAAARGRDQYREFEELRAGAVRPEGNLELSRNGVSLLPE